MLPDSGVSMPTPSRWTFKHLMFAALAGLIGLVLAAVAGEFLVRSFADVRLTADVHGNEPITHEPDPVIGWRSKPGRYVYPGYTPGAAPIRITVLPDSRRATGADDRTGRPQILFVGCSFTEGWAISDEDTYAWQLQQRFPSVEIVNRGVGGYSTYQALLAMERVFAAPSNAPRMVVYGMMDLHPARNIAAWWWLRGMSRQNERKRIELPYCTLNRAGVLVRHPPATYPHWPFRRTLALVRFAEDTYMRLVGRPRSRQRHEVTKQLLVEMQRLCDRHGTTFLVALLSFDGADKEIYTDFMRAHTIRYVDCVHVLTPDMQVPGEGHPNEKMNRQWAEDLAPVIRPLAETGPGQPAQEMK